jgi:hypothetical protein
VATKKKTVAPSSAAITVQKDAEHTSIRINHSLLPGPQIAGYADAWSVTDRGDSFEFVFTEKVNERDVLVARFHGALHGVTFSFVDNATDLLDRTERWARARDLEPIDAQPRPELSDTDVAAVSIANLFRVARSTTDGMIEAYYLAPHDLATLGSSPRPIEAEPVVAVQVPSRMIWGILRHFNAHADELRKRTAAFTEKR